MVFILVLAAGTASAQTIKGVVTDSSGKAIAGASVTVHGTSKGTSTNQQGEFTVTATPGTKLNISSVGYSLTTVTVGDNSSQLTIRLQSSSQLGETVVITALGIKKEKNKIAYATQEVKGAVLEKAPEANVANNLVGKVAGLQINTKTNLFENPDIMLRGEKTLVVIDGVPTNSATFNFWSINPNDIDNINVLKGTAAAALYGALGINGAIMITTKKGKAGAKGIEVTYNTTTQFQVGFLRIPETQHQYGMGYGGYYAFIDGKNGSWNDDYGYAWGPKLDVRNNNTASGFNEFPQYNSPFYADSLFDFTQAGYDDVSHYKPLPWISRGKNNLRNFLQNEMTTTHNITVAGKGDNADYRISVSHMYQKGQVPNTKLNSTSLSLSGNLKATDKLKLEATLTYNRQYSPNFPRTGYGANNFFYNILLWMGADVDIRDMRDYWKPGGGRVDATTGNFVRYGVKDIQQFNYNYTWYNNPWFLAYEALNGYTNDVVTGQLNATYDFNKDLSFLVRSGIITNSSMETLNTPKSYVYYGNAGFNGDYWQKRSNNFQVVTDALLTYKKTFFDNINTTFSAGASNRYTTYNNFESQTNGLSTPGLYNLENSLGPVTSKNRLSEKQVNSVFGYADIDYKRMVYFNITGRKDWTTSLQKPNNGYFYPSASVSFIPTAAFKLPEFISFSKFRAAWAKVSDDNIVVDPADNSSFRNWYGTLPVYTSEPRWNGNNPSYSLPDVIITPGLKPNTTISQEYGAEMRFLKNRIGIDVTYFSYDQKNYIIRVPLSVASGYKEMLVNGDIINRRGIEITLTGTSVRTKNVKWDISANYSTAHKYVKEYYGGATIRDAIKVGERTDVYRAYDWERSPDGKIVYENGIPKYINQEVNIGYKDPDFIFGVTNNIAYKNLNLSFSFDGRIGGIMFNGLEQKLYEGGMHPGTANSYRDDAYEGKDTYVGDGVVVTGGDVTYDIQGNVLSDTRKFAKNTQAVNYIYWVNSTYVNYVDGANMYKRSFVKLREIVLSYNFTPAVLKKTPFKSASVSLTGRNLWMSTKVPFMDPDGYADSNLAEPTYRNIGFNLNLKF
ncbi:MAG: SusC/RagA family TonB-linked outer membrane protein [Ferruginibacter sp.]